MKKKTFTLFAVAACVFSSVTHATTYVTVDNVEYQLSDVTSRTAVVYNGGSCSGDVSIPSIVEDRTGWHYNVVGVIKEAFYENTEITSIELPNSVTSIGESAFEGCTGLQTATIGSGITAIENSVFRGCSSLTSISNILNNVTSVGDGAFSGCNSLPSSIEIPNNITSIGEYAFSDCGFENITISSSVHIGDGAFGGNEITEIHYIGSIDEWCTNTNLQQYMGINEIYGYVLYINDTMIDENLIIPNTIDSIGDYAFYACSGLTSVTIPNSVTSIGVYAFSNSYSLNRHCSNLTSVIIGSGVTNIGEGAFYRCENLEEITCYATTPPAMGDAVFYDVVCSTIGLYVPAQSVNAYKVAAQWQEFWVKPIETVYTIGFIDWDGELLLNLENVVEGTIPEYTGVSPTRPDDEEYTYTFIGWTPEIVAATEDATYTATYEAVPKTEGVRETISDKPKSEKVIRNGQIYILRGNKTYTLYGQEIK